jgi:hypothetical protein
MPVDATRESVFSILSAGNVSGIQWLVNGRPINGAVMAQFSSPELRKGDIVQAKAMLNGQPVESSQILIKNILPTIAKAEITPRIPKANDTLRVDAMGNDKDGDMVTFKCEWSRNGETAGTNDNLEGPFKRGDKISVKITPFDGEENGQTITVTTQIYNSAPKPSGGDEKFENNLYSFRVKADDPDGDSLTYKLKRAPAGMAMDESTGLITWRITEKDAGRHPVSIQISDGHGGEVLYNYDVTLGFER